MLPVMILSFGYVIVRLVLQLLDEQPGVTNAQALEYIELVDEALTLLERAGHQGSRPAEVSEVPENPAR
jgi:hypothetical protein